MNKLAAGLTALTIRTNMTTSRNNSFHVTQQVLREIGKKDGVLNTLELKRLGLGKSFAQFDVTAVTPVELGLVSKNLYALGLIDKTTANLMVSAGTSLDSRGNQTQPNQKMNALDFFAARIQNLRHASTGGNEYGFHVVPDYIKTVHTLQNLSDFALEQRAQQNTRSAGADQAKKAQAQTRGFSARV